MNSARIILAVLATVMLAACAATGDDPLQADTGEMCGGIAGIPCTDGGDYCMMAPRACVEIADAAGVCRKKPEICTLDYNPVCGCDGETYSNDCAAAAAGVSVASVGACTQ